VSFLLFTVFFVKSEIYIHNTNDGLDIESYDCVLVQSLLYCRRPKEPIDLFRDSDTTACQHNSGEVHIFDELQSKNISISTILHQWKSTLERVEQYSRYIRGARDPNGYLCQCLRPASFGKNCEYRLPMGNTFNQTLIWQLIMRKENPLEVQMYGDVVCYETLECDSGVLCLDWREICDGTQHCLSGQDEENCDLLEMNICDDGEYRCDNGMCIPDQFFLDGEFDCLDWSDEMQFKKSENCPLESVNTLCDDHLCPPNEWSCGDGQCIPDRLEFQRSIYRPTCQSGRDRYFMCETRRSNRQWTMSNGRCYDSDGGRYEESSAANHTEEQLCEYLLKCSLSQGGEIGCSCHYDSGCVEKLEEVCPLSLIQYPRGAIVAPFLFFFFSRTMNSRNNLPAVVMINGTVRCRDSLITVTKIIPFKTYLNARRLTEDLFCQPSRNIWSENIESGERCRHMNESTDRCNEWNSCFSITRIKDGWDNCLNKRDEVDQTSVEIEKSCASVRRHRFHCSAEQSTCLSVMKMGDSYRDCQNNFDERWYGDGHELSKVNCNDRTIDECSLLRQYIDRSWTSISMNQSDMSSEDRISFRSYCDTFWDLHSKEDENLSECRLSWVCSEGQWQCKTGQCIEQNWIYDMEWDCADASDAHYWLNAITQSALIQASNHNFHNRPYFIPSTCNHSDPFLCLSPEATRQGFSCFNLSQIGDGRIDCAGAIDERNTLRHCSQSSMLGPSFRCASINTCIPYHLHCWRGIRCPDQSDDEHWCSRQHQPSNCSDFRDFTCFDGRCVKGRRCDEYPDCLFGEDEYMCDYLVSYRWNLTHYREQKLLLQRTSKNIVRLSQYLRDANVTQLELNSISTVQSPKHLSLNISSSTLSPYWCNRGLGVLAYNNSIVCFCPPQYYGGKCEYHADRLSVVFRLDLSQSIFIDQNDQRILLKLVVLFFFNNQLLNIDQFHFHPSFELITPKIVTHFLCPHSFSSRQQRQERFFNRSSLLTSQPYSIRIELYQTLRDKQPSLLALWKYPIFFDNLPVFRLVKVLHLIQSFHPINPCSSNPCDRNEQCQQLMNNKSQYICLCKTNFKGENCSIKDTQCDKGYCAVHSLCQAYSRGLLRRDSLPFCLCPLNRYGDRCSIEHDRCLFNPCLNNGSCFPDSQPDQVICICTKEYSGSRCQWRRPSIRLSLSINLQHRGAVVQFLQIDLISLNLNLIDQQVFRTLPPLIEYFHRDQKTTLPDIVLAKIYSSHEDLSPDIHLLSVHLNLHRFSLHGTTQISSLNQCSHLRTFSNCNVTSSAVFLVIQ
jgi:hypothetical protein